MNIILKKMINELKKSDGIKLGFPDGKEKRIIEAAKQLKNYNIEPIIIDKDFIKNFKHKEKILKIFQEKRNGKNDIETLRSWVEIPNYFVMGLLELKEVDCVVGGATTSTSDLLRPALQIIKSNDKIISSYFWMFKKNSEENYFLGDCAINPYPNASELEIIAIQIAKNTSKIFEINPNIAMLSFSTNGSASPKFETVFNVIEATKKLKEKKYKVLGETQFDAAFDYSIRSIKWKEENLEQPNIYVFPTLDAGNIGYKIMKHVGNYYAIGPLLVGLKKNVNDLSRGCSVEEIINTSIITAYSTLREVK